MTHVTQSYGEAIGMDEVVGRLRVDGSLDSHQLDRAVIVERMQLRRDFEKLFMMFGAFLGCRAVGEHPFPKRSRR